MQNLTLSQEQDTPASVVETPRFSFRYAFQRSSECRQPDEFGQDFLTVQYDDRRLAFAVCDGVGQSFAGDLSARFIGGALVGWFWEMGAEGDPTFLRSALARRLNALTAPASEQVARYPFPQGLSQILLSVLEEKRARGSESMFAAGCLDFDAGRMALAWMGDLRIFLTGPARQVVFQNTLNTASRWSTARGLVGDLNVQVFPAPASRRLTVYSDGLFPLDGTPGAPVDNQALDAVIQSTLGSERSDDISYLEIWLPGGEQAREGAHPWTG